MTVLRGKILPDDAPRDEVFGYHADRNSVHDYATPFQSREEVEFRVEGLAEDPNTYRLRIYRYKLVEVIEIPCAGERPNLPPYE